MKIKHFKKELVVTKTDVEDFENSTKCWICDNVYIDGGVKVKDPCHINRKYWGSSHRDCNVKVKLNHKIPVIFHSLKTIIHILLCNN